MYTYIVYPTFPRKKYRAFTVEIYNSEYMYSTLPSVTGGGEYM
jgi:hypothetical protein